MYVCPGVAGRLRGKGLKRGEQSDQKNKQTQTTVHSFYKRNILVMENTQRKFKLVKRRELTPPVAMKFFHTLKWVSGGSSLNFL